MTFSLNWVPYGLHYGIFAAEAQGYYREAGLDVDIQRGYGSGDTVKRTATGAADIGMADMASVIVGRGNGLAVKQVAILLDRSADAIFYLKGVGISTPKDLPGRSLGATIGETTLNLMPAFAANAGFDHKKVEIVNLAPSGQIPDLRVQEGRCDRRVPDRGAGHSGGCRQGGRPGRPLPLQRFRRGLLLDRLHRQRRDAGEAAGDGEAFYRRCRCAAMPLRSRTRKRPRTCSSSASRRATVTSRSPSGASRASTCSPIAPARTASAISIASKMQHTLDLITKYQEVKQAVGLDDIYTVRALTKIEAGN